MKNEIKLNRAFAKSSYEDFDMFLNAVYTLFDNAVIAKLTSGEIALIMTTYHYECLDSFYDGYMASDNCDLI